MTIATRGNFFCTARQAYTFKYGKHTLAAAERAAEHKECSQPDVAMWLRELESHSCLPVNFYKSNSNDTWVDFFISELCNSK